MSIWKIDSEDRLVELAPGGGEAGVWAPSEQIVFHRAELPPGRQKMWEQTVAFALEEQIAAPIEDQHFAIGAAEDSAGDSSEDSAGGVPVAVVSMNQMQAWADAWNEQGIKVGAVWPDVLAVPFEGGQPTLWHEGGRCLLRLDAQTGLAGSPEWIQSLLEACGPLGKIRVFSDAVESLPEAWPKDWPKDWRARAESLPCSLDERMKTKPGQEAAGMNLLQGEFRTVSPLAKWGRPWAWAGAAAVAAFAFYVALLAAEVRMMEATAAALKQATVELYRKNFPEQAPSGAPVGDLRAQVAQRMAQVRGGVVKREASPWQTLVRVEPLISACKACRVEAVKLEEGTVRLIVSSSAGFDDLLAKLQRIKEVKVDSQPLQDEESRKQLRLDLALEKQA